MVCEAKGKVPIIDLSKIEGSGREEWELACKEMRVGLEEFGCFSVVYDKVSLELHNSIFEATKELFYVPIETRLKNTSEKPYHGYFGGFSAIPLYESMGIDNPIQPQPTQSFANLMWPSTENNHFCETVQRFSTLLVKLEKMVTKMVLESYGVSKAVSESSMESTNYLLRFLKYRVPEKDETDVGLHCHTDLTFFSIIHQHLISGLQVLSPDDQWIDIHPSPHCSFMFMAGDALMAWSNERIRSCRHRVIIKGEETRYSIGMFSFKSGTIAVAEEFVDDANPLRYKPFNHYDFLNYDKTRAAHQNISRIKEYCGI